MFIRVKYGDNETLLCNPACTVINLLDSIKTRSGHTDSDIDLTDESGVVQELDFHRDDCATKYLSVRASYVLVKKQPTSPALDNSDDIIEPTHDYVPLLNNCQQLLPGYRVQRTVGGPADWSRRRQTDNRRKTQSPVAGTKQARSKQGKDRAPSRKR